MMGSSTVLHEARVRPLALDLGIGYITYTLSYTLRDLCPHFGTHGCDRWPWILDSRYVGPTEAGGMAVGGI